LKAACTPATTNNQVPSRPLAMARILVGSATLLQLPTLYSQLISLLAPGKFRVPYSISPPVDASVVPILAWLTAALAIAAIVGWHTRIALAGLAASLGFMLALDQQIYRNDLWLLFLECFLLSLAGSGAAISLDARRAGGKDFVERWPVLLLKIQLSIVYAFSAMSKVNSSFLRGDILQSAIRFDDLPLELLIALSIVAIGTEIFLAVGLWLAHTRRPAMLVGFLLHTSFVLLLNSGPILFAFGLEMLALYMLFPEVRPGEHVVLYDPRSRFILMLVRWARRLDWLCACGNRIEAGIKAALRFSSPAGNCPTPARNVVSRAGLVLTGREQSRQESIRGPKEPIPTSRHSRSTQHPQPRNLPIMADISCV
jgi:hypothetical protein